jgi:hypothetical protein
MPLPQRRGREASSNKEHEIRVHELIPGFYELSRGVYELTREGDRDNCSFEK